MKKGWMISCNDGMLIEHIRKFIEGEDVSYVQLSAREILLETAQIYFLQMFLTAQRVSFDVRF